MNDASSTRQDVPADVPGGVLNSHTLLSSDARGVLTAIGEVVYEWLIGDDSIRWGANA